MEWWHWVTLLWAALAPAALIFLLVGMVRLWMADRRGKGPTKGRSTGEQDS